MADKSTKTDDALLNGEVSCSTAKSAPEASRSTAAAKAAVPAPVMANASTMTNPIEKPSSNNNQEPSTIATAPSPPPGSKLSYAQVAQHHREKQMREERSKSESEGGSTTSSNNGNKQPELRGMHQIEKLACLEWARQN